MGGCSTLRLRGAGRHPYRGLLRGSTAFQKATPAGLLNTMVGISASFTHGLSFLQSADSFRS